MFTRSAEEKNKNPRSRGINGTKGCEGLDRNRCSRQRLGSGDSSMSGWSRRRVSNCTPNAEELGCAQRETCSEAKRTHSSSLKRVFGVTDFKIKSKEDCVCFLLSGQRKEALWKGVALQIGRKLDVFTLGPPYSCHTGPDLPELSLRKKQPPAS